VLCSLYEVKLQVLVLISTAVAFRTQLCANFMWPNIRVVREFLICGESEPELADENVLVLSASLHRD
jgi:hypothetical protein